MVGSGRCTFIEIFHNKKKQQVSRLPDPEIICLALGGLVWPKQGSKGASIDDALTLKKTVIRYVLLSWTMCLSKISSRLKKKMKNVESYIDKGLLTRTEASLLKETFYDK